VLRAAEGTPALAGYSGMQVTTGTYAHASEDEIRTALRGLGKQLG
jgi:hypothetical protein